MYKLFFLFLFLYPNVRPTDSIPTITYYIVRHAEKETATNMTTDVPLSAAGKERATALKNLLLTKNIRYIFSTHTLRTMSTATPLSKAIKVPVKTYDQAGADFIQQLKSLQGNTLVVGHSNTVDDIVNGLLGRTELQDLSEDQFGDLFIVQRKGSKISFQKRHFGKALVH